jgi:hypothetical protein
MMGVPQVGEIRSRKMTQFTEIEMLELVREEWKKSSDAKSEVYQAVIFGEDKEKELAAAKAVEEALWDLWGKLIKAFEEGE